MLMISPSFPPDVGGVETHLNDLCKHLQKSGYRIYVITYQPLITKIRGQKIERKGKLEIHRIQWFGYNLFPKLEPYFALEFLYITPALFFHSLLFLTKHGKKIDVIHAHGINAALIVSVLARFFKKRAVVSIHATYDFHQRLFLRRIVKWILSSFNVILAPSRASMADLVEAGIPSNAIKIYTQWVDQNKFRPLNRTRCKKDLKIKKSFVVLFVGRFIEKKGISTLLEAASKVDRNITFLFIGGGPLEKKVKEKAAVQENIIYVGKVPDQDLVKYYNVADILIVPSQYEEGFGRVAVEALSCGTPVIVANRGGLLEIVNSSVGFFIEPNVKEIIDKIEYLSRNPHKLRRLKVNCRRYAEERFSEKNADLIKNAYGI